MSVASLFAVLALVTDTLCPHVSSPVEAVDVHVRCRAPWSLEWRDAASGAARRLSIDVIRDNIYGDKASIDYIAVSDNVSAHPDSATANTDNATTGTDSVAAHPDSVIAHWDIDAKNAPAEVSLRISRDAYGTHLYAVNGEELDVDADMDINFAPGSAVVVRHDSRVRPVVARAPIIYRFEPRKCAITRDELSRYMAASTDMTEGFWEFMDSDVGVEGMVALSSLRIATLRDDSGYHIVYLSGYEATDTWQAMDIKGRLTPTPFVRDYDLQWYCADGAELGGQIHAAIDEGGSILTLNLGPQPMTVRFRRVR